MKLSKRVSPHVLRSGDRVFQRYNPWNTGIVSHVEPKHRFTVVYDFPGRKSGQPRQRFTYPVTCQENFLIGTPPDMTPPPVIVEES